MQPGHVVSDCVQRWQHTHETVAVPYLLLFALCRTLKNLGRHHYVCVHACLRSF